MGPIQKTSTKRCFTLPSVRNITAILLLLGGQSLQAQDDEAFRRVSVGLRAGGNAFSLLDVTESTVDEVIGPPDLFVSTEAASNAGRFFIGPALQLNVNKSWAFEVDLLTRSAGYQLDVAIDTLAVDDDPAEFVRNEIDSVDLRYWDLPLLVKRYFGAGPQARPYLSGGLSLRTVTGESGERRTLLPEDFEADDDGVIDPVGTTESFVPELARSRTVAAVVAAGIEGTDDFGIKLSLEARYTRWFSNVLDVGFVRGASSQLEIIAGISF